MVSIIFRLSVMSIVLFSTTACLSNDKVMAELNATQATEPTLIAQAPSHHLGDTFRNPYLPPDFQPSFVSFLKARFFDEMEFPSTPENYKKNWQEADLDKIHNPDFNTAQATLIGHSTVLLQYRGINILTDPIFSERSSFSQSMGPKRYTPPALTIDQLPNIDIIVISHNHYDHLDVDSVKALTHPNIKGTQPLWLVPLGLKEWFEALEITHLHEMDWWQEFTVGELTVQAQPSQHWSRRGLFDTNKSLWASWAFIWPDAAPETAILAQDKEPPYKGFTAWFGGDTAYNEFQFKEIGQALGDVDLAMIPIGAYEPRWFMKPQHVNPLDAVEIFKDINAKSAFGIHWNTFVLTAEAVDEPPKALERALQKNRLNAELFQAMNIGATWLQ
jgi:N-acyl-phosphatidylethanolamine-hydrolysing phospholipase D